MIIKYLSRSHILFLKFITLGQGFRRPSEMWVLEAVLTLAGALAAGLARIMPQAFSKSSKKHPETDQGNASKSSCALLATLG